MHNIYNGPMCKQLIMVPVFFLSDRHVKINGVIDRVLLQAEDEIVKFGRTTEFTKSEYQPWYDTIDVKDLDNVIAIKNDIENGKCFFDYGDSGSAVLVKYGQVYYVIGIAVGFTTDSCFIVPINDVLHQITPRLNVI